MALIPWPRRAAIICLDFTFTSLIIVTAATLLLRVPFWGRPLDADEGLYAYGGWQMLKGLVLYRDLYGLKPPGVYFLNALAIFRFDGLLDLLRRDYVRVAQIQGLPFPEQGIYRRKADKGDGRQTR